MRVALISFLVVGCAGTIEVAPVPVVVPEITVVAVAPIERTRPERKTQGVWNAPSALWVQGGNATVFDGVDLKQYNDTEFVALAIGAPNETSPVGSVQAVARRESGIMVAASGGFFHDAPGRLLKSPLSGSFVGESVRFADVVGESMWLTTDSEAVRVVDGHRQTIRINDDAEAGPLRVIVGRTLNTALLVKGGSLYSIDLNEKTATPLARGVAVITAIDHQGDTVLLGTTEGLVEVGADGAVVRRTLTNSSAVAQSIVDIEVVGAKTLVTTATQVLELTASQATVLADVSQPKPIKTKQAPNSTKSVWQCTTMLVFSEFGRTPLINTRDGRDHHVTSSCLVAGPGIKGDTVFGASSEVGMLNQKWNFTTGSLDPTGGALIRPTDIHATLLDSMGVSYDNLSNQTPRIIQAIKR